MNKENFRFYIKVRTALDIQPTIIHDELYTVFGDEAPSFITVTTWSQWFREGREKIEDEPRTGRRITETMSENNEQVQDIIDDDPCITIEELGLQTDLSHGTIQRIVYDHLNLNKVTARYVLKHLSDFQKTERVRICRENLAKFESGVWRLCDVVTGDES